MKNLLSAVIFLFGTTAFACPNLTGTFSCEAQDENGDPIQEEVSISQSEANGITTYNWVYPDDSHTQPADGVVYEYKDKADQNDLIYNWSLTCNGNILNEFVSLKEIDPAGTVVSYEKATISSSLDAGNNLLISYDVFSQGQNYKFQSTCARK